MKQAVDAFSGVTNWYKENKLKVENSSLTSAQQQEGRRVDEGTALCLKGSTEFAYNLSLNLGICLKIKSCLFQLYT